MEKYRTASYEVKSDIDEIFSNVTQDYKPWGLIDHKLLSRTLDISEGELERIFAARAIERPGFEISDTNVYVSNLFVKLSGNHDCSTLMLSEAKNTLKDHSLVFDSISDFNNTGEQTVNIDSLEFKRLLTPEGLLDKEKLFQSPLYQYHYLKIEYQEQLIDKINMILSERKSLFTSRLHGGSLEHILKALLTIDEDILTLYNRFDYLSLVPKIIIRNEDRRGLSDAQTYVLALLNHLGMDIIFISEQGYADVENVFNTDCFSIFYNQIAVQKKESQKGFFQKCFSGMRKTAVIATVTAAAVLVGGVALTYSITGTHAKPVARQTVAVTENKPVAENKVTTVLMPLKISEITPKGPVKDGVETIFKVKVDCNLQEYQGTKLMISANDGKVTGGRFVDLIPLDKATVEQIYYVKSSIDLTSAKGTYEFEVRLTPKKWENHDFKIFATVVYPNSSRTLHKDGVTIEVNK